MLRRRIALAAALTWLGCGGSSDTGDDGPDDDTRAAVDAASDPGRIDAAPGGADAASAADLDMRAEDFDCILDGTQVRLFYLRNPLGDLDRAVEVANSPGGGTYPVGTIVQLIPQEAMVKRRPGWNPGTRDWEFFSLTVSDAGTAIAVRGTDEVVNQFGGNCFGCHSKAEPQWDLICEEDHGCDPLPLNRALIEQLQRADPRCN